MALKQILQQQFMIQSSTVNGVNVTMKTFKEIAN